MKPLQALPLLLLLAAPSFSQQLVGKVVDEFGNPVANVDIDAYDQATGDEVYVNDDVTDGGGFFDAELLATGTYTVVFIPPNANLFLAQVEDVVVTGTANMGTIVLPPGAQVSGRVLRPNGTPYADLDLDLIDLATGVEYDVPGDRTDSQGLFQIPVPKSEIEIQFEPNPNDTPLVAPDISILTVTGDIDIGDVQLSLGYWLSMTVLRSGGVPVQNADIDVCDSVTGEEQHTPGDNTNSSGFVDAVVAAGTYDVEICPALADKLATALLESVVVNGATNLGNVFLQDGWYLTGTVVDELGNPQAKADIDLTDESTSLDVPLCRDKTGVDGTYTLVIPTGTYTVDFQPQDELLCELSITGVQISSDHLLDATVTDDCGGGCNFVNYCNPGDGNPGNLASISASGCDLGAPQTVDASGVATNQNGYLIVGDGQGMANPNQGTLCVIGPGCIGRYTGDVQGSGGGGTFSTDISNSVTGGPNFGLPAACTGNIQSGETWYFQYWHRMPGGTDTFSEAICITFQ